MKQITLVLIALFMVIANQSYSQTADEIIDTYIENIGGRENLEKLETIKMKGHVKQGGAEIPVTVYSTTDGKTAAIINIQGNEIKQNVFDGETLWNTNFQTSKAEKSNADMTSVAKSQSQDAPDPFLDYKDKGYKVDYMGKEDFNGTEVYKIKLTKEPLKIDGKETENASFYFFDTENNVPIARHYEMLVGPGKGQIQELTMSDYQEVDGVYFPFSLTQGVKGSPGIPIVIESIETNIEIDDSMFAFPEEDGDDDKN